MATFQALSPARYQVFDLARPSQPCQECRSSVEVGELLDEGLKQIDALHAQSKVLIWTPPLGCKSQTPFQPSSKEGIVEATAMAITNGIFSVYIIHKSYGNVYCGREAAGEGD